MKSIRCDLPRNLKNIELHTFADEHIGDEQSSLKRLRERIAYVAERPNAYCVLNGDIIDNATKTSIGDIYAQEFNPMEQLKVATEIFSPVKDKILCITHGNHEARTYRKEGIDLSYLLASQLGHTERYTATSAVLFIRFGTQSRGKKETTNGQNIRKLCYTVFMLHGSGGGRKEGAKAIRLADMAAIVDTDIYIHSHTHLPMVMKQAFHRVDSRNSVVALVEKLFVNTASNLDYGGYGEANEFKPTSKTTPIIYLDGTKKTIFRKTVIINKRRESIAESKAKS